MLFKKIADTVGADVQQLYKHMDGIALFYSRKNEAVPLILSPFIGHQIVNVMLIKGRSSSLQNALDDEDY